VSGKVTGLKVSNAILKGTSLLRHKFGAVRTERDGIKFASKKEAAYYDELTLRKRTGEVLVFLRQVPFHLPGGVKYVCDFAVFYADGRVEFVDVKGMQTAAFKAKRKMVESVYAPVQIVLK